MVLMQARFLLCTGSNGKAAALGSTGSVALKIGIGGPTVATAGISSGAITNAQAVLSDSIIGGQSLPASQLDSLPGQVLFTFKRPAASTALALHRNLFLCAQVKYSDGRPQCRHRCS